VLGRPDLKVILSMLFLIGTFGLNFPIYISTMSVGVFHVGAGQFGLLTSMMAAGSVTGALLAAARTRPGIPLLAVAAAMFGVTCAIAAFAPFYLAFGLILFTVGLSAQTFTTSTNSLTQLSTEPAMRGRVIAILMAIALGGTPIGAPIVGWIADQFSRLAPPPGFWRQRSPSRISPGDGAPSPTRSWLEPHFSGSCSNRILEPPG
jgi:MFS family permease